MHTLTIIGLGLCVTHAAFGDLLPTFRYRHVGGLRFLRFGRLQLSFCICRRVEV